MLLCLLTLTITAQHRGTFNERLFNAKVDEITYRLRLSDKQVEQFRPIYKEYNKDMIAAWGNQEKTVAQDEELTTTTASTQVKQRLERQRRAQDVRIRYTDKFATVLTPNQLERFFKVENDIQRRLRDRKMPTRGRGKAHRR